MNVRSLSLSETGAMIYCSSIDISESGNGNESTIPIMAQPTSPTSLVFNERLVYSPFLQKLKVWNLQSQALPKAASKQEGPKKFGVPDKKAVLL